MKIKNMLSMLILGITIIFVSFILFTYFLNKTVNEIKLTNKNTKIDLENTKNLYLDITNYFDGNLDYTNINKRLDKTNNYIKDSIKDEEISTIFDSVYKNTKEYDFYWNENEKLLNNIYILTNESIKKSRTYTEETIFRLADERTQNSVTKLERLVILGADKNTVGNLQIQTFIEKLKLDSSESKSILVFLKDLLQNTEKDIENLRGTFFENLPVESKNSILDMIDNVNLYVTNIEKMKNLEKNVFEDVTKLNSLISEYDENIVNSYYNKLFKNAVILIVLMLVILLTSLIIGIIIYKNINRNIKVIREYINELKYGNLSYKAKHIGKNELSEISEEINLFVDDLNENLLSKLDKVSKGEYINDVLIKSEKDEIGPKIKLVQDTLNNLVLEIDKITRGAVDGNFGYRCDIEKFKGNYKKILIGINNTIESITNPIIDVSSTMDDILSGNLDASMNKNYKGKYLELSNSVNNMVRYLKSVISQTSNILNEVSIGNLSINKLDISYRGEFENISLNINKIIDSLNGLIGNIYKSANEVSYSSKEIEKGSNQISKDASEQASSIEEITATMEVLSENTKNNSKASKQANNLVDLTTSNAVQGTEIMKDMLISMEEINESSVKIRKIIKVIDEIAFQTNILAINASIEAESAGQYGRGFSVVADEVRSLAVKCAEAAKETTVMIEESIKKVSKGIRLADETSNSLSDIYMNAKSSSKLVKEITGYSEEQSNSITQISTATILLANAIQLTTGISKESANTGEKLSIQSDNLKSMINKFKLKEQKNKKLELNRIHRENRNNINNSIELGRIKK
ncbi:MAG: methyl-accepting chemotaxis protein [Clostridiales bacterium]